MRHAKPIFPADFCGYSGQIAAMQSIDRFLELTDRYDALLCDLWGVIHDGVNMYPGVHETLETLHRAGKRITFLSNAPRTKEAVVKRLDQFGIAREWYQEALSSGQAAIRFLNEDWRNFNQRPGTPKKPVPNTTEERGLFYFAQENLRYYYLGLEQDANLCDHLPQERVEKLEEADFLLNSNFETLMQPAEALDPLLNKALEARLPMLCINPDMEVVRLDGTRILCAGALAERYREMGGTAFYIGKPYALVYDYALRDLLQDGIARERILMVGDNLFTDILGAQSNEIDSALITGGVLKELLSQGESLEAYCKAQAIEPTWLVPSFGQIEGKAA
jgi:HAD superfamily hydrolase (TIGR01450 family)